MATPRRAASEETLAEDESLTSAVSHTDQEGFVGERSILNGSVFDMGPEAVPLYQWMLVGPNGAPVPLTNADKVSPSFTPDMPGMYKAMLPTPSGEVTVSITVKEKSPEN